MTKKQTPVTPSYDMPTEVFDEAITWKNNYRPEPVFLKRLQCSNGTLDLFAVLFEASKSIEGGEWKFQEYVGVYCNSVVQDHLHFRQHGDDVVFTPKGTEIDEVEASKKREYPMLNKVAPEWKWSDAWWPEYRKEPMAFVGQARARECDGLSARDVYLFCSDDDEAFAIYVKQGSYQSAEEHYDDEAARM